MRLRQVRHRAERRRPQAGQLAPVGRAPEGQPRPPGARYPLIVGLIFVALIAYATYNTIQNEETGLLGTETGEGGQAMAEFAVPDARGDLLGDANIFQDDCESGDNPCPADERRVPACLIEEPGALRVCDYFDKPLAISFWFTKGGDCLREQDEFDRVASRYADQMNFLSINIRDDIEDVKRIVSERGWEVPVGWDRDGAVSNVYGVGICPTLALAYPGGILEDATFGSDRFTEESLQSAFNGLIAESNERAEAVD